MADESRHPQRLGAHAVGFSPRSTANGVGKPMLSHMLQKSLVQPQAAAGEELSQILERYEQDSRATDARIQHQRRVHEELIKDKKEVECKMELRKAKQINVQSEHNELMAEKSQLEVLLRARKEEIMRMEEGISELRPMEKELSASASSMREEFIQECWQLDTELRDLRNAHDQEA